MKTAPPLPISLPRPQRGGGPGWGCIERGGWTQLHDLAGITPRFQRARERGRRAAATRLLSRQPFGARGGVLCTPRARYTYAGEPLVPPGCSESGLSSFAGPSGGCAWPTRDLSGAPLATGCRAFHCGKCTASSHLPRPSEGASLATALRTGNAASSRAPALPRFGRSADASAPTPIQCQNKSKGALQVG